MPNVKISQLPVLTNVLTNSVLPVVQSGTTYQASVSDIVNFDAVPEDILPLFDGVYDLGSTTKKWYDLYLTNALYLGNSSITVDIDNDFISNTNFVVQGAVSADSGDFGDVLISGNTITYLGTEYNPCLIIDSSCVDFTGDVNIAGDVDVTGDIDVTGTISLNGSSIDIYRETSRNNIYAKSNGFSAFCEVDSHSVISGGRCNMSFSTGCSVISGGFCNVICSFPGFSSIVGGQENKNSAPYSFIGGGCNNRTTFSASVGGSSYGFIGGGINNIIRGSHDVITGGQQNSTFHLGGGAFVGGGRCNSANGIFSAIVGGCYNRILETNNSGCCGNNATFIGGGFANTIERCSNFSVISGGFGNNICCCSTCANIGGGACNNVSGQGANISGGLCNTVGPVANCGHIGGGRNNCANGDLSAILGGQYNSTACANSFIIGSCITADRTCATFVNNLSIKDIPTSSVGLPAGSVWSDSGTLKIV